MPIINTGSASQAGIYASLNKTTAGAVAGNAAIVWDPAGGTGLLSPEASWQSGNTRLTLTRGGVFNANFVLFPGNPTLKFGLFVDGVQKLQTADAGTIFMGQFSVPLVGGYIEIKNMDASSVTMTGAVNDAQISISSA